MLRVLFNIPTIEIKKQLGHINNNILQQNNLVYNLYITLV